MLFTNRVYNVLKWCVMILLPATATLYFGLSLYWPVPNVESVVGTITLSATFLGTLIGLSSRSYNKDENKYDGVLQVNADDPEKDVFSFVLYEDPEKMAAKNKLTIKVDNRPAI